MFTFFFFQTRQTKQQSIWPPFRYKIILNLFNNIKYLRDLFYCFYERNGVGKSIKFVLLFRKEEQREDFKKKKIVTKDSSNNLVKAKVNKKNNLFTSCFV